MQTHFHLVLESLDGDLSSTMRWLQSKHVGHFNRTRGQFGPLVGGRFKSFVIDSGIYLFVLIRYVDLNPVEAGLVVDPLEYEFGSAAAHAYATTRPPWLARDLIRKFTSRPHLRSLEQAGAYRAAFCLDDEMPGAGELVRARLNHRSRARDDLDALLQTDGPGRRAWVVQRAAEADGTTPGLPMVNAGAVLGVVDIHRLRADGAFVEARAKRQVSLWDVAAAGLLRELAGLGFKSVARALDIGVGTASRRYEYHLRALRVDPAYLSIVGELTRQSLELCFGPRVHLVSAGLAELQMSRRGWKID